MDTFYDLNIIPLKWDSTFWGIRIAKVNISTDREASLLVNQQKKLRSLFDLIYVFSKPDVIFNVPQLFLVDKKTTYKVDVCKSLPEDNNIVEYNKKYVSNDLKQLALISGKYSRFKIDPFFSNLSYERLYTCWIEESVKHNIATEVFCYMVDNSPKGLITLSRELERGDIGLISTHPDFQRQGIASKMLAYVNNYMYTKRGEYITVVTQKQNTAACYLYEKAGYVLTDIVNVWHWWLNCSTKK